MARIKHYNASTQQWEYSDIAIDPNIITPTIDEHSTDLQAASARAVYTMFNTLLGRLTKSWRNVVVSSSGWVSDSTVSGYAYKQVLSLEGVTSDMAVNVSFGKDLNTAGKICAIVNTVDGGIEIWSNDNTLSGTCDVIVTFIGDGFEFVPTFTLKYLDGGGDTVVLEFEHGQTWGDWVNSAYNTINAVKATSSADSGIKISGNSLYIFTGDTYSGAQMVNANSLVSESKYHTESL